MSTFSGVGGFEIALAGHTCVGWSEIDPYASAVYRYHFPHHPEYGDITKIDAAALPDFDLLVGGFPCFTQGTLVLTYDGWRPIESLAVGTLVLTHKGRWRPVTAVMRKVADATVVVHGHGFPDIHTTSEHPFYVRKQGRIWNNDKRQYDRTFADPEWVDAGRLSSEYRAGQVLPDVLHDSRGTDFWWVVGRYLADGWRTVSNGKGRVVICANKNERDYVRERIERVYAACGSDERTVTKFHITRKEFCDFLEPFGKGANGKGLPGWVYQLPAECAESLLDGYLTGDGSRFSHGWKATTVSRSLALSIGLLAQRARGIVASIYEAQVPPTTVIEGRTVRQQKQYQIVVADHNRSAIVDGAYGWKRIVRTIAGSGAEVFNISVEDDESYVADGVIVHNCQSHSVAGKRLAFDDDRGQLFFDLLRILDAKKPEWFIFENVAGLLSSDGGRALGTILGSLVECGYGVAWRVLDARHAGVPQRRRRIFLVGYLGDERAGDVLALTESLCGDSAASGEARQNTPGDPGRRLASGPLAHALTAHYAKGGDPTTDNYVVTPIQSAQHISKSQNGIGIGSPDDPMYSLTTQDQHAVCVTPILEAGARTGVSTDDPRAGIGIGNPGDPMFTLQATKQHAVCVTGDATHALRAEGADASEDGTGRGTPIVARAVHETGHGFWQSDDSAATVRPSPGGTHANLVAFALDDAGLAPRTNYCDCGTDYRSWNDQEPCPDCGGFSGSVTYDPPVGLSIAENQRAEVLLSDTTGALKTGGGKPGQGYPAVLISSVNDTTSAEPHPERPQQAVSPVHESTNQKVVPGQPALGVSQCVSQASVLRSRVHERDDAAPLEGACSEVGGELPRTAALSENRDMRNMPAANPHGGSPQGREQAEQQTGKPTGAMPGVPHEAPSSPSALQSAWVRPDTSEVRILREAQSEIQEVGRPAGDQAQSAHAIATVRRLTATECERLMSWPDFWTAFGRKPDGTIVPISDSRRYRMVGNGVVSAVVRQIVERIEALQ